MTDSYQTEAALGKLINLSGKMRMLSHRAVMAAMQSALIEDESENSRKIFEQAAVEFDEITEAMQSGSSKLGIPGYVAELLEEAGAQNTDIQGPVARFSNDAKNIRNKIGTARLDTGELARFSTFVAHDLLNALNALNGCVSEALQAQLSAQRVAEESARKAVLSAVQSISDVSMKVKLISLNASVEAARAGEHGRGFAVIAQEIRTLSEDAAASTKQIAGHLQKMA